MIEWGEGGRQAGPNFGGLVLGCIEANLCDQIFIFQHFSRSTRLTYLCTASNSNSSRFSQILQNFVEFFRFKICQISFITDSNHMFFVENFAEFRRNFRNLFKSSQIREIFLKFWKSLEFLRCEVQAGSKMKMTLPPLRVRRTLIKYLREG